VTGFQLHAAQEICSVPGPLLSLVILRLLLHLPVSVVEGGGAGKDLGGKPRRDVLDFLGLPGGAAADIDLGGNLVGDLSSW
jgi:hypothetical protein